MITNKYYFWYCNIVNCAKQQGRIKSRNQYYERHHIIPKSIGGTNDPTNLVLLTPKEHFVCHHLLTKCTEGTDKSKMIYAFWGLTNAWGRLRTKIVITSKVYEALKKDVAKLISLNNTGRTFTMSEAAKKTISISKMGEKNPMFGKPSPGRGTRRPGVGGRPRGSKWSPTERANKMAVRMQPGYYDYTKNPERNKKISNAKKGRPGPAKGKFWFNNGIIETWAGICPDGFTKGRLPNRNSNKKGMLWYNNGQINRQFREGTEEQGFVRGRISKK